MRCNGHWELEARSHSCPPAPADPGAWTVSQSLPESTLLISILLCDQVSIPGPREVYLTVQAQVTCSHPSYTGVGWLSEDRKEYMAFQAS